jgi:hypothetical protein
MALAGLLIELLFQALGLVPPRTHVAVFESTPTWNVTTFLNLAFLAMTAVLGWRFLTTGGPEMLRMMNAAPGDSRTHGERAHH